MISSQKLKSLGYVELAERVENGEFDEETDDLGAQGMRDYLDVNMDADTAKAMKGVFGL